MCDILFCAVIADAAYVAIGSLCGAILIAAPLLGFFGLASSKEHDDGIDWSDHRMGGQPRNPGPKIRGVAPELPDVFFGWGGTAAPTEERA
ncbi:hypothetical protein [Streptomyces coeruleorubidus]|uniref:hypothetical protein n=1 Tax=Streptomyces coeruleorubidus TaxID=116188 RepID=UPI00368CCF12